MRGGAAYMRLGGGATTNQVIVRAAASPGSSPIRVQT